MQIHLDIELPRQERAVGHLRRSVQALCEEMGVRSEDVHALVLALSEACNNVVLHALADDTFAVEFDLHANEASVTVTNARTPNLGTTAREDVADDSESGRGMDIIEHLVDEASFVRGAEGGTLVSLRRTISAEPGSLLDVGSGEG